MAGGHTLAEKRDRFYRELAMLLVTPLEAIVTWDSFLKAEQAAIGLLHDATNLKSKHIVHFSAQGIKVDSGSALTIQQEFGRAKVQLTEFRVRLNEVKERLRTQSNKPEVQAGGLDSAMGLGMPEELAAAYVEMTKSIKEVDPAYGEGRRLAAERLTKIGEARQKFAAVFEKYFGKPDLIEDSKLVQSIATAQIPADGHVQVCNGKCQRYDGAAAILKYLRTAWDCHWTGRTSLYRLMKSDKAPHGPIPVKREDRYLWANECRLDAWAALHPRR